MTTSRELAGEKQDQQSLCCSWRSLAIEGRDQRFGERGQERLMSTCSFSSLAWIAPNELRDPMAHHCGNTGHMDWHGIPPVGRRLPCSSKDALICGHAGPSHLVTFILHFLLSGFWSRIEKQPTAHSHPVSLLAKRRVPGAWTHFCAKWQLSRR